ncbi:hypothetical protein NQZ68_014828 [Dissostichus eleginoides]|nr:hypothetical protein NQZ68_014828 [Dissostichus eleginoides]
METLGLTVVGRPLISMIQDYTPPAKTTELHPNPPTPTSNTTSLAGLSSTSMLHPHPLSTPTSDPCPSPITPLLASQEWVKAKSWVQLV